MIVLVVGGSGSGKSSYAEQILVSLAEEEEAGSGVKKYYLATMQVYDEEGQKKVDRHRKLRNGKDFLTIEQPTDIHRALDKMGKEKKAVLVECISNLTANEMFSGKRPKAGVQAVKDIMSGMKLLKDQTAHLVIVTNHIFEDGYVYDDSTMEYIRAMGKINQELAAMSDRVVEVVVGIPVFIKQ